MKVWRGCVDLCISTMPSPRASRIRTRVCFEWQSQFALPFHVCVRVVMHSHSDSRIDQMHFFNQRDTSQDLESAHIVGFALPWYSCTSCKHYHLKECRLAGWMLPYSQGTMLIAPAQSHRPTTNSRITWWYYKKPFCQSSAQMAHPWNYEQLNNNLNHWVWGHYTALIHNSL